MSKSGKKFWCLSFGFYRPLPGMSWYIDTDNWQRYGYVVLGQMNIGIGMGDSCIGIGEII